MQTIYTYKLDDTYYTDTNEHTPYSEHIILIFKYFSAVYKNISFMW